MDGRSAARSAVPQSSSLFSADVEILRTGCRCLSDATYEPLRCRHQGWSSVSVSIPALSSRCVWADWLDGNACCTFAGRAGLGDRSLACTQLEARRAVPDDGGLGDGRELANVEAGGGVASATHTPFGMLLLAVPPVESIPLPKPAGSGSRSYVACWELRSCVRFIVVGRSRVRGARVAPLGEHGSPEPGSGGGMGGDSRVVRPAEPLDTPSS